MPTKKAPSFEATLTVMGRKFKGKGKTIADAIENLEPGSVAGTCILVVKGTNGTKERIIPMSNAKRLFMTRGLTREVALKQISSTFDGV